MNLLIQPLRYTDRHSMSGRAGEIVTKKRRKKKELWPVGTQQHVCTSEEAHFNAGDEESKNSLARLTPDVLIVLLNILLKCQLACGEWQSDKTDADRGRNPSLTFIISILLLKTFHLLLMSWPRKDTHALEDLEALVKHKTPSIQCPDL